MMFVRYLNKKCPTYSKKCGTDTVKRYKSSNHWIKGYRQKTVSGPIHSRELTVIID